MRLKCLVLACLVAAAGLVALAPQSTARPAPPNITVFVEFFQSDGKTHMPAGSKVVYSTANFSYEGVVDSTGFAVVELPCLTDYTVDCYDPNGNWDVNPSVAFPAQSPWYTYQVHYSYP